MTGWRPSCKVMFSLSTTRVAWVSFVRRWKCVFFHFLRNSLYLCIKFSMPFGTILKWLPASASWSKIFSRCRSPKTTSLLTRGITATNKQSLNHYLNHITHCYSQYIRGGGGIQTLSDTTQSVKLYIFILWTIYYL